MTRVRFARLDGSRAVEVDAPAGSRLLDVAQACGQPLEGTCGGALACATCHVILDPTSFAALSAASVEEEDMLDFAEGARRTSRLSCQVRLTSALDNIEVRIPS